VRAAESDRVEELPVPLAFRLSENTDPKPRTFLTGYLGEKSVGGAVHPHNWSMNPRPQPAHFWHWTFSIGQWKWKKPSGGAESRDEAESCLISAWGVFSTSSAWS
jgi:hypothetical protein